MRKEHREPLLAFVRKLGPRAPGAAGDRQLLERFCLNREETAFATLVERHGSMVLSVCRRVLGDHQEAEDAFQATFLVLARRAGSIGKPELLSNWLYGVALRTAWRARVAVAQRRVHEKKAAASTAIERVDKLEICEVKTVIDKELNRLPARHRAPIVLCYLEGKSQEDAAAQLGWTKGSLRGRLDRAREKLRKRLLRRGLGVTVGAINAALTDDALSATVPAALAQRTADAAVAFAAGVPLAGAISSGTIFLTRGVLNAMLLSKLKLAGVIVLTCCLIGTGVLWGRAASDKRADARETDPLVSPLVPEVRLAKVESKVAPPQEPAARQNRQAVRDQLDQRVTLTFDQGTRLQDALDLIQDKYNLTILIDEEAFKKTQPPKARRDAGDRPVRLWRLADVKLGSVLRMVLQQAGADYVIQNDFLIVVPQTWIDSGMLLRQPVDVTIDGASLHVVLEALARKTGASVVLDERVAQEDQTVTMRLERVPLVTAVSVIADTKGLKAVPLRNMIYVTSKENAKIFEAQQAPALREVSPYFNPPSPEEASPPEKTSHQKHGTSNKRSGRSKP